MSRNSKHQIDNDKTYSREEFVTEFYNHHDGSPKPRESKSQASQYTTEPLDMPNRNDKKVQIKNKYR